MISQCIHGFPNQQCGTCRQCEHGAAVSACLRCRSTTPARRPAPLAVEPGAESYQGYEIYYVAELSGWQYRGADSAPSHDSYRSAFLARKAVDRLLAAPPPAASRTGRAKRVS